MADAPQPQPTSAVTPVQHPRSPPCSPPYARSARGGAQPCRGSLTSIRAALLLPRRRSLRTIYHCRRAAALRTWLAAAEQRKTLDFLRVVAIRFRRHNVVAALRCWRASLVLTAVAHRMLGTATVHMARSALRDWRVYIDHRNLCAAMVLGVSRRADAEALVLALYCWRRSVSGERRLRGALNRMERLRVLAALCTWRGAAAAAALSPTDALICGLFGDIQARAVATSFLKWAASSRLHARLRRVGRRLLAYRTHHAVMPALNRWASFWRAMKRKRQVAQRAAVAFHGEMGRGWRSWRHLLDERERSLSTLRLCLYRWRARNLLVGWKHWLASLSTEAETTRRLTSVVAALRNDARRRALRSWAAVAAGGAAADVALRRAIGALRDGVPRMLHQWRRVCAELAEARGRIRAALMAMGHLSLARCFRSWADLRIDPRHAALRTLLQPRTRQMRRAWNSIAAAGRLRADAARLARRMLGMASVRCLNTWASVSGRRKAALARVREACGRLFYRHKALAMAAWVEQRQTSSAHLGLLRGAAKRLKARGRGRAFRAWHAHAERRRRLLWRAAARFRVGAAGSAFATWQGLLAERQAAVGMIGWAASRLLGRAQMRMLKVWREMATTFWLAHSKLLRAVSFFRCSGCALAMNTWRDAASSGYQQARLCLFVARALRRRIAARCLRTWHIQAQISGTLRWKLVEATVHGRRLLLKSGLQCLSTRRRLPHELRAALYAATQPLRLAFRFWAMAALAKFMSLRRHRRQARSALRVWVATAACWTALRRTVTDLLRRCRVHGLRGAFTRWAASRSSLVAALVAAARSRSHNRRATLREACRHLRAAAVVLRAAAALTGTSKRASRRACWRRWRASIAQRELALERARRSVRTWRRGLFGACFAQWRQVAAAHVLLTSGILRHVALDRRRALVAWSMVRRREARRVAEALDASSAVRRLRLRPAWDALRVVIGRSAKAVQLRKLCFVHSCLGTTLAAFRTWRRVATAAAIARSAGSLLAHGTRRVGAAWRLWTEVAMLSRVAGELLRASASATMRHESRRLLRRARARTLAGLAAARALRHWRSLRVASGWHALLEHAQQRRRLCLALTALGGPVVRLHAALQRWRARAVARAERRVVARRALHALRGRAEVGSFAAWADAAAAARLRRSARGQRLQSACRRWARAETGGAFRSWRGAWREARLLERVLGGALESVTSELNRRHLLQAWRRLHWVACLSATGRPLLLAARSHQTGALTHALATLATHAAVRIVAARAVRRMKHSKLTPAFLCWRDVCNAHTNTMLRIAWAGRQWRAAGLAACLRTWRASASDGRRLRWAFGLLGGELACERRAWASWVGCLAATMTIEGRMRAVAFALVHNGVVRALRSWQAMVGEWRFARLAVYRMVHHHALRAFRHWRERCIVDVENGRLRMWTARRFAADPAALALAVWRRHASLVRATAMRVQAMQPARRLLRASYDEWRQCWSELREARRLQTLALLATTPLARALRTWRALGARWAAVRLICRRVLHSSAVRALLHWRELRGQHAHARLICTRVLASCALRMLAHWRGLCATLQQARRMGHRMLGWGVAIALDRWRLLSASQIASRRLAARVHFASSLRALRHWLALTDSLRSRRRLLARVVHHDGVRALTHWREVAAFARAKRRLGARVLGAGALRALHAWQELASTHERKVGLLERAVRTLRHAALARAVRTLAGHAAAGLMAKATLMRAVHRWGRPALARALRAWAGERAEARARELAMEVAGRRWLSPALAHALRRWMGVRAGRALHRKAVLSWLFGHLLVGFSTWRHEALARASSLSHLRRALSFLRNDGRARALAAWRANTAAIGRALGLVLQSAAAFAHGGLRRALRSWSDVALAAAAVQGLLRRTLAAWLHRSLRRALTAWAVPAAAAAATAAAMRRCGLALLHRGLRRAWTGWAAHADAASHQRGLLRRFVLAWTHRQCTRAWVTWRSTAASADAAAGLLRRSLAALVHRGLRLALTSWIDAAREHAARAGLLYRAGAALMLRDLHRAHATWRVAYELSARLRRAAAALVHSGLARATRTWHAAAVARLAALRTLRRAVSHLMSRHAALAFHGWSRRCAAHATGTAAEERSKRTLLRWRAGKLAVAWRVLASLSAQVRSLRHHARRVLLYDLVRALRTWRATCEWRTTVRASLRRWVWSAATHALGEWQRLVGRRTHVGRVVRAALVRWHHARSAAALARWKATALAAAATFRSARLVLRRWQLAEHGRAFASLAAHAAHLREAIAIGRLVVCHIRFSELGRAMRTWTERLAVRSGRASTMAAVLVRRDELRLLWRWRLAAHHSRRQLGLARRALDVLAGRGLAFALATWRGAVNEWVRPRRAVLRAGVLFYSACTLRRGWDALLAYSEAVSRTLQKLAFYTQAAAYANQAALSRALVLWHQKAYLASLQAKRGSGGLPPGATWRQASFAHASLIIWTGVRHALVLWRRAALAAALSDAALACADDHRRLTACRSAARRWRNGGRRTRHARGNRAACAAALRRWQVHVDADADNRERLHYAADCHRAQALFNPLRWWRYRSLLEGHERQHPRRQSGGFAPSPTDGLHQGPLDRVD